MTARIEVAFKGNRKDFYLWDTDEPPAPRTAIIVEADRGEDLGHVHAVGELAAKRYAGVPQGLGEHEPGLKALRLATDDDVRRARELPEQDEEARKRAMERVKANGLVMKLTDAEWQWDRKKLTFYFTAEKRVDFRALVRDLAAMFRTRIELKQIGVRDEAKRLGGIGRCGREYCSASWLPELRPVNLGVAKDQKLSLNPSQISGACGRLMCCLRYEHDFYVQARKRFPKEGRIVVTVIGEERIVSNDIFRERVTLRNVEGETRIITLVELRAEMEAKDGSATMPIEPIVSEAADLEEVEGRLPMRSRAERPERRESTVRDRREARVEEPEVKLEDQAAPPTESAEGDEARPRRRRGRRGGRRTRRGGEEQPPTQAPVPEESGE